jgi:hypothetical protein
VGEAQDIQAVEPAEVENTDAAETSEDTAQADSVGGDE